jgi:quercetin dioxygenase-like cupin family protein
MITHLKLPLQFDAAKLNRDLLNASGDIWTAHFNTFGYEGSWSVIPLYAPNGDQTNIIAHHTDNKEIQPTPVLENCNYFGEVIQKFQCPVISARLMKLDAGAVIKPHRDHESGYEDGMFRIHVPVLTNPLVEFILDAEKLPMKQGECWYTNVNFEHSVANKGTEARVHLVIDYARNNWSDELFFSLAPKENFVPKEQEYTRETLVEMIRALESFNNPLYQVHIEEFKRKLMEN